MTRFILSVFRYRNQQNLTATGCGYEVKRLVPYSNDYWSCFQKNGKGRTVTLEESDGLWK